MKTLIVDDEPLAIRLLEDFLQRLPFVQQVKSTLKPTEAMQIISEEEIDLLFLDINMPDMNGLQFLRTLPRKPALIFTTAHNEFALAGYEHDAVDFLLKPISFERFATAVNKAREFIQFKKGKDHAGRDRYCFIRSEHKMLKLVYDEILFLQGFKDYTKIHFCDRRKPVLTLHTLKNFEDSLPASQFMRIHRSYIVNLSKIETISKKMVTLQQQEIPLSESYREALYRMVEKIV